MNENHTNTHTLIEIWTENIFWHHHIAITTMIYVYKQHFYAAEKNKYYILITHYTLHTSMKIRDKEHTHHNTSQMKTDN